MHKVDKLIIGGGITGLSTAAFLGKDSDYLIRIERQEGPDSAQQIAVEAIKASLDKAFANLDISSPDIKLLVSPGFFLYP